MKYTCKIISLIFMFICIIKSLFIYSYSTLEIIKRKENLEYYVLVYMLKWRPAPLRPSSGASERNKIKLE